MSETNPLEICVAGRQSGKAETYKAVDSRVRATEFAVFSAKVIPWLSLIFPQY